MGVLKGKQEGLINESSFRIEKSILCKHSSINEKKYFIYIQSMKSCYEYDNCWHFSVCCKTKRRSKEKSPIVELHHKQTNQTLHNANLKLEKKYKGHIQGQWKR